MKEIIEENKKAIILLFICIIISIILVFFSKVINNKEKNKADVDEALTTLADIYYGLYYDSLDEYDDKLGKEKILENDSIYGKKVTLEDFIKNIEDINLSIFINEKQGINCEFNTTNVIIFPMYPYGRNDYNITINKNCDVIK